jgi:hypothetical protein
MRLAIIIIVLGAVFLSGCTTESSTVETLEKAGFTDIETQGWDALGCSDDDFYSTKFTAKNVNNQSVEGTVCCGLLFKRCTIRY